MVSSPAGLGIKDDCAGETQQQFTRPDYPLLLQGYGVKFKLSSAVIMICGKPILSSAVGRILGILTAEQ
jgi:hypothetical protein